LNVCRAEEPEKVERIRKGGEYAFFSAGKVKIADGPRNSPCIREAGEYTLFDGKMKIVVTVEIGLVGYDIRHESGGRRWVRPTRIRKDSDWFIYPLSANEVWMYDGRETLDSLVFGTELTRLTGGTCPDEQAWKEHLKTVPRDVFVELPERIRSLKKKDDK
jgi:hypothetical protein